MKSYSQRSQIIFFWQVCFFFGILFGVIGCQKNTNDRGSIESTEVDITIKLAAGLSQPEQQTIIEEVSTITVMIQGSQIPLQEIQYPNQHLRAQQTISIKAIPVPQGENRMMTVFLKDAAGVRLAMGNHIFAQIDPVAPPSTALEVSPLYSQISGYVLVSEYSLVNPGAKFEITLKSPSGQLLQTKEIELTAETAGGVSIAGFPGGAYPFTLTGLSGSSRTLAARLTDSDSTNIGQGAIWNLSLAEEDVLALVIPVELCRGNLVFTAINWTDNQYEMNELVFSVQLTKLDPLTVSQVDITTIYLSNSVLPMTIEQLPAGQYHYQALAFNDDMQKSLAQTEGDFIILPCTQAAQLTLTFPAPAR
jgi:hypothetical protein